MEYLLKTSAILGLFYIFFKLFLKQETFFLSIRIYFLAGIFTALILPLIVIKKYIALAPVHYSEGIIKADTYPITAGTMDWLNILTLVYLFGIIVFSLRFLIQLISLLHFLSIQPKVRKGKYVFVNTSKNIAPFSFFHYIVINDLQFTEKELIQILTHEKIHVDQFHSIDILTSQLMVIVQWFNPFVWLLHKEIQNNLEFIADAETIKKSNQRKEYHYLLLKTSSRNLQTFITTNFYDSILKKRLTMTQKTQSKKVNQLKLVLLVPVLIAFVLTFNTKIIAQQTKEKNWEVKVGNYKVDYIITKDEQKSVLDENKDFFAKHGITVKYSNLKYNAKNEIIAIKISVKDSKGNTSTLSQNSTVPISPIKLSFNKETGAITLGNITSEENWMTQKDHKVGVFTKTGDSRTIISEGESIFISDDGKKHVIKIKKPGDADDVIWISEKGDTLNQKSMKVKTFSEDDGKSFKVIIEEDGDINASEEIIINTDGKKKEKTMVFISSDKEKPLMIVDGKEITNGSIDDISPDK
ncbi:MAG: M56 family metallopeptidase, partial [Lutimonas sp.]